jgi:hypothetical protein
MKKPVLQVDERNVARTRKICTRLYLFTIAALWLDVFWRQIVLHQSLAEFWDLAALMTANIILFIGAVLYFGGVTVPKIRASLVVSIYLGCVAIGTGIIVYQNQMNFSREVFARLLVVAAIAGIIIILYVIAASLGARRTDREIDS